MKKLILFTCGISIFGSVKLFTSKSLKGKKFTLLEIQVMEANFSFMIFFSSRGLNSGSLKLFASESLI